MLYRCITPFSVFREMAPGLSSCSELCSSAFSLRFSTRSAATSLRPLGPQGHAAPLSCT